MQVQWTNEDYNFVTNLSKKKKKNFVPTTPKGFN